MVNINLKKCAYYEQIIIEYLTKINITDNYTVQNLHSRSSLVSNGVVRISKMRKFRWI